MIRGVLKKVGEFLQQEAPAAGPAARDAALHGTKEFAKVFWKKYRENRGKH
jgi:phosphoribosylamine-glycine ligase